MVSSSAVDCNLLATFTAFPTTHNRGISLPNIPIFTEPILIPIRIHSGMLSGVDM